MSTLGDVPYVRGISCLMWGIPCVHRGISVHQRDTMSTSGGYHEYNGKSSVHQRDIMIHVGEQLDKILLITIENSDVLNIPRYAHGIPLMY